jgi:hypothetical protein
LLPFVSGAGGSVWPAMHGRRGVVCARRLYVTVVCVHYAATDSLTVRGHARVAAWYGDVVRRHGGVCARRLDAATDPGRAVTFIAFYFSWC